MTEATYNEHTILNVKQIIDEAFGDLEKNKVNFKLIQTVLYLLARQLRFLERKVVISVGHDILLSSGSSLQVTEIKIKARDKKKAGSKESSKSASTKSTPPGGSSTDRKDTTVTKKSSSKKKAGSSEPSSDSASDGKRGKTMEPEDYFQLLDEFETQREKELRMINQRAKSYEEQAKTPTPIASLDSDEAVQEKLLVVERHPSQVSSKSSRDRGRTPQLSIVTQEQFDELTKQVRELQQRFGLPSPEFLDSADADAALMKQLSRSASLTDAMGALQLSARLEAAEKALQCMIGIVTDVVSATPGVDKEMLKKIGSQFPPGGAKGAVGKGGAQGPDTPESKASSQKAKSKPGDKDVNALFVSSQDEAKSHSRPQSAPPEADAADDNNKYITYGELQSEIKKLENKISKFLTDNTGKSMTSSEQTLKSAQALERKLTDALAAGERMAEVEALLNDYAEKVNNLDSSLTSQLGSYQEQLTQMQNDLEVGVETMTEALGNTSGDETVIAELNSNFNNLQADFEVMTSLQKELNEAHEALTLDLESLWAQIEALRAAKSDRDEVVDALRDKAGIAQLNALVSVDYFNAVQGDFQKRIGSAYDKFNSQEAVWQKSIDDLLRNIDEKADRVQVECLRSEINRYLNMLNARMQFLADIVGEPKAAALTKRMFRESACLCCGSPAIMFTEEPGKVPSLPAYRDKTDEEENEPKPKEDGDYRPCTPGLPITHPRDSRAHLCRRYCGGSHTLLTHIAPNKIPSSLTVEPIDLPKTAVEKLVQKINKQCSTCHRESVEEVVIETTIVSEVVNSPTET